MKTEEGVVVEVTGDKALVRAGKHNDCKNCGACPGNDAAIIEVSNKIGAKVGQRVRFELRDTNVLKGAFIIFILPLIALFAGALAGGELAASLNWPLLVGRISGAILLFAITILLIRLFDKRVGKIKSSLPDITDIIK